MYLKIQWASIWSWFWIIYRHSLVLDPIAGMCVHYNSGQTEYQESSRTNSHMHTSFYLYLCDDFDWALYSNHFSLPPHPDPSLNPNLTHFLKPSLNLKQAFKLLRCMCMYLVLVCECVYSGFSKCKNTHTRHAQKMCFSKNCPDILCLGRYKVYLKEYTI